MSPADLIADDVARYRAHLRHLAAASGLTMPGEASCPLPRRWGGATIGGPRAVVAVATTGQDTHSVSEQAREAASRGADLVELRLDLLTCLASRPLDGADDGDAEREELRECARSCAHTTQQVCTVLAGTGVGVLVTVRTASEGGAAHLDERSYELLLSDFLCYLGSTSGVVALDVEIARHCLPNLVERARQQGIDVVASAHFFDMTPPQHAIEELLATMEDQGAHVAKIAVMPDSQQDVDRLVWACVRARALQNIPLIAIAMGERGAMTRLVGSFFGSALTFATAGAAASAPGQLPIEDVRAAGL